MPADSDLLRRYAQYRDDTAFRELVARHLPLVYGAALRRCRGNTHVAQEIAQAVFIDLARKASGLTQHPTLTGWLHRSTRYAAATLLRTERRRQHYETEALSMQEHTSPADASPDWDTLRPLIDDALDRLSTADREILLLRFFENHTFAAIGEQLALSEDAARKRTERALQKLGRVLGRHGLTSTSAALGLALTSQASSASIALPATLAASIGTAALAHSAAGSAVGFGALLGAAQAKFATAALVGIAATLTAGSATLAAVSFGQRQDSAAMTRRLAELSTPPPAPADLLASRRELEETLARLTAVEKRLSLFPPRTAVSSVSANGQRSAQVAVLLADHPEYQTLVQRSTRTWLLSIFGDLLDEMPLSATDREAVISILVKAHLDYELARNRARAAGRSTATDETKVALRVATDDALRVLLGEGGLKRVRQTESAWYRTGGTLRDLAADFQAAGHPLTRAAEKRLSRLLDEYIYAPAQQTRASGAEPAPLVLTSGLTPAETTVAEKMGTALTPSQHAALIDFFKFERARADFEARAAANPHE
jgi:RNA polymerase sigma factor (sigma-70 family)